MEKLVSSWNDGKTLPKSYIFPADQRPRKNDGLSSKAIPIIDLGKAEGDDRKNVVEQIMEASQQLGYFQVVNHGVPKKLMDEARAVYKNFFELPLEEKGKLYSSDTSKKCVLYTSNIEFENEEIHLWRDALKHYSTDIPLEDCMDYWPDKPANYRVVTREYILKMKDLGSRVMEMICEGLGLESGYFEHGLSQAPIFTINMYPSCPYPSLVLGAVKHTDPNVLSIVMGDNIPGLQFLHDGEWVGVDPLFEGFVVFVGNALKVVSNNKLKSAEHRVVTNVKNSRISAAYFVTPARDCIVEPAKALVTPNSPALYKSVKFGEFYEGFRTAYRDKFDPEIKLKDYAISSFENQTIVTPVQDGDIVRN